MGHRDGVDDTEEKFDITHIVCRYLEHGSIQLPVQSKIKVHHRLTYVLTEHLLYILHFVTCIMLLILFV
jgi:hypothetical protein